MDKRSDYILNKVNKNMACPDAQNSLENYKTKK